MVSILGNVYTIWLKPRPNNCLQIQLTLDKRSVPPANGGCMEQLHPYVFWSTKSGFLFRRKLPFRAAGVRNFNVTYNLLRCDINILLLSTAFHLNCSLNNGVINFRSRWNNLHIYLRESSWKHQLNLLLKEVWILIFHNALHNYFHNTLPTTVYLYFTLAKVALLLRKSDLLEIFAPFTSFAPFLKREIYFNS